MEYVLEKTFAMVAIYRSLPRNSPRLSLTFLKTSHGHHTIAKSLQGLQRKLWQNFQKPNTSCSLAIQPHGDLFVGLSGGIFMEISPVHLANSEQRIIGK